MAKTLKEYRYVTEREWVLLTDLISEKGDVITSSNCGAQLTERQQAWEDIANDFNFSGLGSKRTARQLKRIWDTNNRNVKVIKLESEEVPSNAEKSRVPKVVKNPIDSDNISKKPEQDTAGPSPMTTIDPEVFPDFAKSPCSLTVRDVSEILCTSGNIQREKKRIKSHQEAQQKENDKVSRCLRSKVTSKDQVKNDKVLNRPRRKVTIKEQKHQVKKGNILKYPRSKVTTKDQECQVKLPVPEEEININIEREDRDTSSNISDSLFIHTARKNFPSFHIPASLNIKTENNFEHRIGSCQQVNLQGHNSSLKMSEELPQCTRTAGIIEDLLESFPPSVQNKMSQDLLNFLAGNIKYYKQMIGDNVWK